MLCSIPDKYVALLLLIKQIKWKLANFWNTIDNLLACYNIFANSRTKIMFINLKYRKWVKLIILERRTLRNAKNGNV